MNDDDLIRAVQQGDRDALTTLYQRHLGGVWRYLHSHLARDVAATEDLVSETFLAAIRLVATYDGQKGTFYGWLLGIARNKLRDHLRKKGRREGEHALTGPDEVAVDEDGNPEARLIQTETRSAVRDALDALADEERLVLEWKYVDSLSVREIADRLDRTPKAVEAVLYRARIAFREAYARRETQRE
jgi:RNA polymerase sigma-70 factor, ECF subfamily